MKSHVCHTVLRHVQVGAIWAAAGIFSYSLGGTFSLVDPTTGNIIGTQVRSH